MEEGRFNNYDLLLQTIGIIIIFSLIFISNSLSTPVIEELNSGAKITDLMFNSNNNVDIPTNLFLPLFLLGITIALLGISIWNLVRFISIEEITFNKIIIGALSILLFSVLIKVLYNSWSLFVIALLVIIVCLIIIGALFLFIKGIGEFTRS